MGLLSSLFKRGAVQALGKTVLESDPNSAVEKARTQARQRLVGAVVLVAAGVIGFPMLFENQPRSLPLNTPVEIVRKEPAASVRSLAPLPKMIQETALEAGREVVPQVSAPERAPERAIQRHAPSEPAKKIATPVQESAAAQPKLVKNKPEPAPEPGSRFVVQVAAYADAQAAHDARKKIEKLGLSTYTQVIGTSSGQRVRVRVGPFGSRAQAEQALHKLKSAGMSSSVVSI
jgi:DedD protein